MRTFPFIFISLHSSNSSIPLLYKDSHPDYPHLYTHFLAFPPLFPASSPIFPTSHPDFPHSYHSHPDSHAFPPWSPHSHHSHSDSPHSHHSHPVSSHSHHSPHSVPRFPIPAFTDSQKFMLCIWDCISVLLYMYQLPNTNMSNKYCQRYLNIVLSTLKQLQLINVEPTLICNQIIFAACFCLSCVKYFVLSVIEESFFAKHQLFKYIRQKLTQILP